MAKPELGTKRVDPETGRKFYDLNKDPIVSPFTGKSYPLSFFETVKASAARAAPKNAPEPEENEEGIEVAETDEETVSINDVEDEDEGGSAKSDLPNVDGDEDDDVVDDDSDDDSDDTFLADEEDEDDDMTDIIGGGRDDEDDA